MVAVIGVSDLLVVETADAILVADRSRAQDVKKVVDHLKREGRSEHEFHTRVFRPWGWYEGIDAGDRFQVKRISVKPGAALSLQMHHHRAEHWIVVRGTARVTRGEETCLVVENESTFIPLGTRHRLENPGKVPPGDDRGAVRELSRRGRYRPLRGQLRTTAVARLRIKCLALLWREASAWSCTRCAGRSVFNNTFIIR